MTIGEQLEIRQPYIYNFLIECFGLNMKKTDRKEPALFPEDDPEFAATKVMMEKPRGVTL